MEEINESLHLQLLDFDREKRMKWMKERKPFSVLFEVTPRCNMNCIHCYLKNSHISSEMGYERIIELIDILYENQLEIEVVILRIILYNKKIECSLYSDRRYRESEEYT